MKSNKKKSDVFKHSNASLNPWLLLPSREKHIVDNEHKITLGHPDDGRKAIIDDFSYTTLPNSKLPIDIARTATSNWFPGTSVERPAGVALSIEFVVEGRGELIVNGQTYDLIKNDVYILHNTESYVYRALPPDRFIRKIIYFNSINSESIFKITGLDKISRIRMPTEDAEHILYLMTQIDEINRSRQDKFMLKMSSLTYNLILLLSDQTYDHADLRDVSDYLIKAVEFAMKNLGSNLHVIDLANAASCSESYLTKIFKQNLGMNPHQWIELQKIRFAARRLQLSRMKIYEIADELGYSDSFHFSRTFKRMVGVSPSEFRQKNKH